MAHGKQNQRFINPGEGSGRGGQRGRLTEGHGQLVPWNKLFVLCLFFYIFCHIYVSSNLFCLTKTYCCYYMLLYLCWSEGPFVETWPTFEPKKPTPLNLMPRRKNWQQNLKLWRRGPQPVLLVVESADKNHNLAAPFSKQHLHVASTSALYRSIHSIGNNCRII